MSLINCPILATSPPGSLGYLNQFSRRRFLTAAKRGFSYDGDIYDLGSELAGMQLPIAMAESHDASDEDVSFLENVVANRGEPIRFFDTEREAKDWLGIS
jgi:hypothetical protein